MKGLKVRIKDGRLIVGIPVETTLRPSLSGKTLLVATTGGMKRAPLDVEGKPLQIILNAFVYDDAPRTVWNSLLEPGEVVSLDPYWKPKKLKIRRRR